MNSYEKRQTGKKAYYEEKAKQASEKSAALQRQARELADHIPMGQPLLVGHHNERRHRRHLSQIDRLHEKAREAAEEAERYDRKAHQIGRGGISSDDPDAVEKLQERLSVFEEVSDRMKVANRIVRSKKSDEEKTLELTGIGLSEEEARALLAPDYMGKVGYPSYALQNVRANIRRIKKRIDDLETKRARKSVEKVQATYTYREDVDDNRVWIEFNDKPAPEVRAILKSHGFRWSPRRGAWVTHLNSRGIRAARQVMQAIE